MEILKQLKEKLGRWLLKQTLNDIENEILSLKDSINYSIRMCEESKNDLSMAIDKYSFANLNLKDAIREAQDAKRIVNEIVEVGTDVDFYSQSGSWAVICIDGKPEYMKFVRFDRASVRELQEFLKRFEYSRHVVDSPHGFDKDFWFLG